MFPTLRHRLTIFAAVVVAGLGWSLAAGYLQAPAGGTGLSLFTARVGLLTAIIIVLLTGLPALGFGAVAAAVGYPLSGIFVVTASLAVLAGAGGPIDDWLRQIAGPAAYRSLVTEMLIWSFGLAALMTATRYLRPTIRRWVGLPENQARWETRFDLPDLSALGAGLICAAAGGVLAFFLIRSSDGGQVIWSLVLAFTIGAMLGQMAFPTLNVSAVLLAPALVAIAAYLYVLANFTTHAELLQGWYTLSSGGNLPGLALALPIHYISAGVVGCTLGIRIAHGLESSRGRPTVVAA